MSHYTEGRRWSHIHQAWVFSDQWNDKEEIASREAEIAELKRLWFSDADPMETRFAAEYAAMKKESDHVAP